VTTTRRTGDALLAAAVVVLQLVSVLVEDGFAGERTVGAAAAVAVGASLLARRRLPLVPLAVAVGVIALANAGPASALPDSGGFLVALVIANYSGGAYLDGRAAVVGAILVAAAIPLAAREPGQPLVFGELVFIGVLVAAPWAVGRLIRARRVREVELERERDARAGAAVAEERARIARELHDVVAHAISVIVVQARGGRKLLATEPAETSAALDTIEVVAQQALGEMRRLLGLLRDDDAALALAPQPGLARVGELVERVRAAGLPVELCVEGDPADLPPGVDVSAYRIVQEALTNALKHAGDARARVTIRHAPGELELEVLDDGAGHANGDAPGHGLAGMRERVAVYGGKLEAGRRPEGGFALRARLPLGGPR
jgi:signal transduction histidine kinase